MYNPDFWEVQVDQADLERLPQESGIWYESSQDRRSRYVTEDRNSAMLARLETEVLNALTRRQRETVTLYFQYGKTQREIAQILGMSRRVVSQHLFGITRNGKSVGGAVKKIRKLCLASCIELAETTGASTTE